MTRWKAAGIHLGISVVVGLIAFSLLYFVYYPQPYFAAAGADKLVLILLGVDVVLGPLLTLVVFKSGKKTLKFDLATIAGLQLAALVYGLHIMWFARPAFLLAVIDRIEIVYANTIEADKFAQAEFAQFKADPLFGPIRGVTRRPLPGPEQEEILTASFNGADIQLFPRYFQARTSESFRKFLTNAKAPEALPKHTAKAIAAYLAAHPYPEKVVGVPMKGRVDDYTVLLDAKTGEEIVALPVSAWSE